MREVADAERIRRLMHALGAEADREGRVYFTGGATAVLLGWRASTIDVDLRFEPEIDSPFVSAGGRRSFRFRAIEWARWVRFYPSTRCARWFDRLGMIVLLWRMELGKPIDQARS